MLAIIFSNYDLEISIQIANQNSVLAKFLENYGMIPGLIVILSGIFINYSSLSKRINIWSYIKKTVFFLTSSGILLYLADIIVSNNSRENIIEDHFIVSLIISFSVCFIIFIILHIKTPVQNLVLIKFSKVVLGMAFFGYVICIQLVKIIWGRCSLFTIHLLVFTSGIYRFRFFSIWSCSNGLDVITSIYSFI